MESIRKYSRKREAILDCLRHTKSHPSADWVYSQLKPDYPDLSLATVYRNLAMFKRDGVIISVGTVNGLERFDYNTLPHAHFVCSRCAAVIDVDEIQLPQSLCRQAEQQLDAQVTGSSICFTGLCSQCKNQKNEPEQQQIG